MKKWNSININSYKKLKRIVAVLKDRESLFFYEKFYTYTGTCYRLYYQVY